MAKLKACPVCGQKVSIEKLEAHVKKVHPKEDIEIDFDETEEKQVKQAKKANKPGGGPQGRWIILVSVILIVVVILAFVFVPRGLGPGSVPPDFTLNDTNSIPWNLDSHKTGKPILLEFMHPDCGACQSMTTVLNQIYQNYQTELEMITIAITLEVQGFRNPPTNQMMIDFKNTHVTPWTYLVETSGTTVRDLYEITSTPTFYLIADDGRIAIKHIGTWVYEQMVSEILPYIGG